MKLEVGDTVYEGKDLQIGMRVKYATPYNVHGSVYHGTFVGGRISVSDHLDNEYYGLWNVVWDEVDDVGVISSKLYAGYVTVLELPKKVPIALGLSWLNRSPKAKA